MLLLIARVYEFTIRYYCKNKWDILRYELMGVQNEETIYSLSFKLNDDLRYISILHKTLFCGNLCF